jgi:hypothetical protein
MPIDIVRKNKKRSPVDLKKRGVVGQKIKNSQKLENKKGLEERLENRFSHLPNIAYKQRLKILWLTVIFFTLLVVIIWFYLVSRGVLLRTDFLRKAENEDSFNLSDIVSGIKEVKDNLVGQVVGKKDVILNLKKQLELASEASDKKNEIINSLKETLERSAEDESGVEVKNAVSASENLIISYPLSNYYIDNPIKILGRGKPVDAQFEMRLKSDEGRLLGESSGSTEDEQVVSSFSAELNYIDPDSENGVLELYTLNKEDGKERDLVSIPVKFISGLSDWNIYSNEEWGLEFKYPNDRTLDLSDSTLVFKQDEEAVLGNFYVDYFINIRKLKESYAPALSSVYENLDSFLESGILGEGRQDVYIGGLNFNFIKTDGFNYIFLEKDAGGIISIKSESGQSGVSTILDQILATFKFINPDLDKWQEYEDVGGEVAFKYPERLSYSEEFGQSVFQAEDPDDFSFYFFVMEPQIDNLQKWIEESSVNLEEEIVSYEEAGFGDAARGVYYEAESILEAQDSESTNGRDEDRMKSFGYIFNNSGATYSFRTNKEDFLNTFKGVLDTIEFTTLDYEIDSLQEEAR